MKNFVQVDIYYSVVFILPLFTIQYRYYTGNYFTGNYLILLFNSNGISGRTVLPVYCFYRYNGITDNICCYRFSQNCHILTCIFLCLLLNLLVVSESTEEYSAIKSFIA